MHHKLTRTLVRRRTTIVGATALAIVTAAVASVGIASATTAPKIAQPQTRQASHATKKIIIGYACPRCSVQGLQSPGYGMKQAIKLLKLPWTLKILDSNLSSDKQVTDINTFISLGAKAITSWTLNTGATDPAFKRARAAGIDVIGINSPSKYQNANVESETDSTCDTSKQQAQYIASLIPHAKVISIGGPPVPSIQFFTKCWLNAAKAAGLDILEHQDYTTVDSASGQTNVAAMLLRHPDAQALWSWSDEVALGGLAALQAAGKTVWSGNTKGVVVVSRDALPEMITAIKQGKSTASWDGNYPEMGAAAIQLLKKAIVDKKRLPKTKVVIHGTRWDISNASRFIDPLHRKVTLLPTLK